MDHVAGPFLLLLPHPLLASLSPPCVSLPSSRLTLRSLLSFPSCLVRFSYPSGLPFCLYLPSFLLSLTLLCFPCLLALLACRPALQASPTPCKHSLFLFHSFPSSLILFTLVRFVTLYLFTPTITSAHPLLNLILLFLLPSSYLLPFSFFLSIFLLS